MARTRHGPEQIVAKLRQIELEIGKGTTTPVACKKAGITEQTFYRWRKEYGGMKVDQTKRLKELEKENARLSSTMCSTPCGIAEPNTRTCAIAVPGRSLECSTPCGIAEPNTRDILAGTSPASLACAQRLGASQSPTLGDLPKQDRRNRVLNALQHRRAQHPAGDEAQPRKITLCSTPCGIAEPNTFQQPW